MQVSSELVALLDIAMSPSRPPQPTVEPSVPFDCHTDCWSLCENSLGGKRIRHAIRALVLRERGRLDQRTDVELHREPARIPQRLQSRELRRQCVLQIVGEHLPARGRQRRGSQLRASVGDATRGLAGATAANCVVQGVVSVVVRDHGVGVVVAAVHEEAHQRLVVGVVEGRGFADGGEIDRQRRGDAHRAELQRALQDDAARPESLLFFSGLISAPGIQASTG